MAFKPHANAHPEPDSSRYHHRQSQSVAVNRRRRRQLDWEDTRKPAWVAWLSGVCTIMLLLAVLALGATGEQTGSITNGDQLGPYDLTRNQYQHLAKKELAEVSGDQPRWALVLATEPWTANSLSHMLSTVEQDDGRLRVSTVYGDGEGLEAEPLGEPARGHTRQDVLADAAVALSGGGRQAAQQVRFTGMLVYGHPDLLRALDKLAFSVQPAPVDATYGKIGIRTRAIDQPPARKE